jgi:acetolactate synthase I/III small subunit
MPSSASWRWSRWRAPATTASRPFRARVVDATNASFVFELTGKTGKVEQFISLMQPLGLVEVVRTGIAAISRGVDRLRV